MEKTTRFLVSASVFGSLIFSGALAQSIDAERVQIGSDANSANNPIIQPANPAESGGGRDQSLQFGDVLVGTAGNDLLIGRLGTDVILGGRGNDVMLGGTEHFNPFNRDRAFGGPGNDVFVWSPGDGSDLFNGGPGNFDTLIFGLVAEIEADGEVRFGVRTDQQAGDVFLDPATNFPVLNLPDSPGFCQVIDRTDGPETAAELDRLGLDHAVRFVIRGLANSFEAGEQDTDNGVRVTLHLQEVEYVICTTREGGEMEIIDLTNSPPTRAPLSVADHALLRLLDPRLGF